MFFHRKLWFMMICAITTLAACTTTTTYQPHSPRHNIHHQSFVSESTQQINNDKSSFLSMAKNSYQPIDRPNFYYWLIAYGEQSPRVEQAHAYYIYLSNQIGADNMPAMADVLVSSRSWERCGAQPYNIPPRHLWTNMVMTIKLFNRLQVEGVLPADAHMRSGYRDAYLNSCSNGASRSKHLFNSALDLWVPSYNDNPIQINLLKNRLCEFWNYHGSEYNFGLGLYHGSSVHIDTYGYRRWGADHTSSSSPCRN